MDDVNNIVIERVRMGDVSAIDELISRNRGLTAHIANRYKSFIERRNDIELDDLMQAGHIGILTAAGAYAPERGAKFSTYAVFFMRKEMRRTLGIRTSKRDLADYALSLDAPFDDDGDTSLIDTIAANDVNLLENIEKDELYTAVRAAVERIECNSQRKAVENYYLNNQSTVQIAEAEGVSTQMISDRLIRGCEALRRDKILLQ